MSRQVTLTITKIEGSTFEVTKIGDRDRHYVIGDTRVTAIGLDNGEQHTWTLHHQQRCWIGDTVQVTVLDPPEGPQDLGVVILPLTPPPVRPRT